MISWVWAGFVFAGPVAIGVALYQRIDDHEKRRRRELREALANYLRQTFQNGWQRWDEGHSLGQNVTSRFQWYFEEGDEMRAELTSFDNYHTEPRWEDPGEMFLYKAGRLDRDDFIPCSFATAALEVHESAPGWAIEVSAVGISPYPARPTEATIGKLALSAREKLHEYLLNYVEEDTRFFRENWVHLVSPTCDVELPTWAAERLGLPDGSTFGDATKRDAWPWSTYDDTASYE